MAYKTWADMLYTEEEFAALCAKTECFDDDKNPNHRARSADMSFSEFIDSGSDALLEEDSDFVADLL